jgi:type II secretory pathway pseudopilin PulG
MEYDKLNEFIKRTSNSVNIPLTFPVLTSFSVLFNFFTEFKSDRSETKSYSLFEYIRIMLLAEFNYFYGSLDQSLQNLHNYLNSHPPSVSSILCNNIGCCHYKKKQRGYAAMWFAKALKEGESMVDERILRKAQGEPPNTVSEEGLPYSIFILYHRPALLSNCGLSLLSLPSSSPFFSVSAQNSSFTTRGLFNPELAFHCFKEAVVFNPRNMHVWLRLAECCIAICKKEECEGKKRKMYYHHDNNKDVFSESEQNNFRGVVSDSETMRYFLPNNPVRSDFPFPSSQNSSSSALTDYVLTSHDMKNNDGLADSINRITLKNYFTRIPLQSQVLPHSTLSLQPTNLSSVPTNLLTSSNELSPINPLFSLPISHPTHTLPLHFPLYSNWLFSQSTRPGSTTPTQRGPEQSIAELILQHLSREGKENDKRRTEDVKEIDHPDEGGGGFLFKRPSSSDIYDMSDSPSPPRLPLLAPPTYGPSNRLSSDASETLPSFASSILAGEPSLAFAVVCLQNSLALIDMVVNDKCTLYYQRELNFRSVPKDYYAIELVKIRLYGRQIHSLYSLRQSALTSLAYCSLGIGEYIMALLAAYSLLTGFSWSPPGSENSPSPPMLIEHPPSPTHFFLCLQYAVEALCRMGYSEDALILLDIYSNLCQEYVDVLPDSLGEKSLTPVDASYTSVALNQTSFIQSTNEIFNHNCFTPSLSPLCEAMRKCALVLEMVISATIIPDKLQGLFSSQTEPRKNRSAFERANNIGKLRSNAQHPSSSTSFFSSLSNFPSLLSSPSSFFSSPFFPSSSSLYDSRSVFFVNASAALALNGQVEAARIASEHSLLISPTSEYAVLSNVYSEIYAQKSSAQKKSHLSTTPDSTRNKTVEEKTDNNPYDLDSDEQALSYLRESFNSQNVPFAFEYDVNLNSSPNPTLTPSHSSSLSADQAVLSSTPTSVIPPSPSDGKTVVSSPTSGLKFATFVPASKKKT